jgi:hypothetical protein
MAVLLILPVHLKEALRVGIPRLKIWSGQFTDTSPDPITLSDAESVGAESDTDYSNPYVNHKTKSGFEFSHVADNEAGGRGRFGLRNHKHTSSQAGEVCNRDGRRSSFRRRLGIKRSQRHCPRTCRRVRRFPFMDTLHYKQSGRKSRIVPNFLKDFHCIL